MKSTAVTTICRVLALLAALGGLVPLTILVYGFFHWETRTQTEEAYLTANLIRAAVAALAGAAVSYALFRIANQPKPPESKSPTSPSQ